MKRTSFYPARFGAMLCSALLAGCSLAPEFVLPKLSDSTGYTENALPDETASTEGAQGTAQRFAVEQDIAAQWWKVFESEPLNELITRALKNSPSLQAAEARLKQAQESLAVQEGSSLPSVDINARRSRQKFSSAAFGQPNNPSNIFTLYNASIDVSYGIDIFGKLRGAVESLEAEQEAERYRYEAAYLALTSNIVTTAVQEASLRAQITEREAMLALAREQLSILKAQLALGGISQQPVLAQETSVAQLAGSIPSLQQLLAQTRNQLAILIGQSPGEPLDVTFDLDALHLPETLPVSLPSQLVEQRPDIKASQALLRAANARIGVATANMLPQLTLTGSYGSTTPNASDLFSAPSVIWNFATGLTQPLFRGGELLHRKRGSEAAYAQADAEYRATVLTAFANVSDSLTALQYDAETLKEHAAAAQAAAQNKDLATTQYESGSISQLALLDAQRNYQQSQIALIQARAARLADSAALFQALGGGWWNRDAPDAGTPDATPPSETAPAPQEAVSAEPTESTKPAEPETSLEEAPSAPQATLPAGETK